MTAWKGSARASRADAAGPRPDQGADGLTAQGNSGPSGTPRCRSASDSHSARQIGAAACDPVHGLIYLSQRNPTHEFCSAPRRNAAMIVLQACWVRTRRLGPASPSRSQPRCSRRTAVRSPRDVKVSSTSVASLGSKNRCHRYLSLVGGSQSSTFPQGCSAPSAPCSTIRPPERGSKVIADGAPLTVCHEGHQVAHRRVQASNA